jgi:hypothetical protein
MISILRNAGFGVSLTVSRHARRVPACVSSPLATPRGGPRIGQLRLRKPVLRHPQRERAHLERSSAIGALRDRTHAGGQRDGKNGERDQHFDQRERARAVHQEPFGSGPAMDARFNGSSALTVRKRGAASANANGPLRPDARNGTIAFDAMLRPA